MPNSNTFQIPVISDFVNKYITGVSVDPFARESQLATYTNDLNPSTKAQYHFDAVEFLQMLVNKSIVADCIIFDPPYSPRQITECYSVAGLTVAMRDTQNARLYSDCRKEVVKLCKQGSVVLSFGWNSAGMGKQFETEEIMLVAHGGAHNDTICMADRLIVKQEALF